MEFRYVYENYQNTILGNITYIKTLKLEKDDLEFF